MDQGAFPFVESRSDALQVADWLRVLAQEIESGKVGAFASVHWDGRRGYGGFLFLDGSYTRFSFVTRRQEASDGQRVLFAEVSSAERDHLPGETPMRPLLGEAVRAGG